MIQFLFFPRLQNRFGEALGDSLARFHAFFELEGHATVGLDEGAVELLAPRCHAVGQLLEKGDEVDEVRDRARAVPTSHILTV